MYTCSRAANLVARGGLSGWRETGDQWAEEVMEETAQEGRKHHFASGGFSGTKLPLL